MDEIENQEDEVSVIHQVTIVSVSALDIYKSCLLCRARIKPMTQPLGKCSKAKCAMIQRYDLCLEKASAKILVQYTPEPTK